MNPEKKVNFRNLKKEIEEVLDSLIVGLNLTQPFPFKATNYENNWVIEKDSKGTFNFRNKSFSTYLMIVENQIIIESLTKMDIYMLYGFDAYACEGLYEFPIDVSKGRFRVYLNNPQDIITVINVLIESANG